MEVQWKSAVSQKSNARNCHLPSQTHPDEPRMWPETRDPEEEPFSFVHFPCEQLVLGKSLDALSALALHIDVRDGKIED
jgi:hypothetical protein